MDRDTSPQAIITGCILRGEQILQSARLVGDRDDLAVWRPNRDAWISSTLHSLEHDGHVRARFLVATRQPTAVDGWRRRHDAEVRAVEAGLELLMRARRGDQLDR